MRKTLFFAISFMAITSCAKTIDVNSNESCHSSPFEAGQVVSLKVNTPTSTKVTSELNAGSVDFKWQTGDKIKISVGGASAEFSLVSGAGTASATFTGAMPASGETFDVQYPCSTPDLSSQPYSPLEAIPHDKMMFSATGCSLGTAFSLEPCFAALLLNLYGLNRDVSQIVVTDTTTKPNVSYTLTCTPAVRVGNSAETATPFFVVVHEGSWGFKVDVTSAAATAALDDIPEYDEGLGYSGKGIIIPNNSFATSVQSFTAGVVRNMAAKPITIIWAPVNCGYKAADGEYKGYTYGRMYQWGRKYGQGYIDTSYEDDDYPRTTDIKTQTKVTISTAEGFLTTHPDGADYNGNFYCVNIDPRNWYAGADADKLWNKNEGTGNPVSKSEHDPCPNGWRVPTKVELEILKGTKTSLNKVEGTHGTSTVYGSKFDGSNGESDNYVFLPIAGYINFGGSFYNRGNVVWSSMYYWSSTAAAGGTSYLLVKGGKSSLTLGYADRSIGGSVRCVKEN